LAQKVGAREALPRFNPAEGRYLLRDQCSVYLQPFLYGF